MEFCGKREDGKTYSGHFTYGRSFKGTDELAFIHTALQPRLSKSYELFVAKLRMDRTSYFINASCFISVFCVFNV